MKLPTMTSEQVDSNPNMLDMPSGSTHWKCTLRYKGRQMTVYFSMGPAHREEPKVEGVLGCLALDAMGCDNARGFDDWCAEYGYDTDSRKAEATYKATCKQTEALHRLLGPSYGIICEHVSQNY